MKYKNNIINSLLIVFMLFSVSLAQSQKYESCSSVEECVGHAEQFFENGDFYSASVFYFNALQFDSTRISIAYKYAEASRLFNNYKVASDWYHYVLESDSASDFSLVRFWYAAMLKNCGDYDSAISNFKAFTQTYSKTDFYSKKSQKEIQSCEFAIKLMKDTVNVKIEHLPTSVNSPYSEFGAVQLNSSVLYFSALRAIGSMEYESFIPNAFLSKIYISKNTTAGWSKGKEIDKVINNKTSHNANVAFNDAHTKMYFTRCSSDENSQMQCAIYLSVKEAGEWQKPVKLKSKINLENYTSTQPAVANIDDYEILYFVSDRPNGYGGNDIWYSVLKDGVYNEPVNLGSLINTQGNEITPFYYNHGKTLYFSSDWHNGLGAYDVFKSKGGLNSWEIPVNLGFPINSSCNDIYFTKNGIDKDGYFTSNRPGSYHIKGETCCNDIYYYEWDEKKPEIVKKVEKDTVKIEDKVKLLLPLTLYFHNDIPDPKSTNTTTNENYKTTLADYFLLKEKYEQEYSKGLKGEEKEKAVLDIKDFFDNYISKGFSDLEKFSDLLLTDLEKGSDVRIKIKGYCSPLNSTEYNLNLAKRRIASLKNFIAQYDEGIFKKYLDYTAENGGKLTIYEDPIGEAKAKAFVSDNPNDKRNSIYSRAAAFERKIQIILYTSGGNFEDDSLSMQFPEIQFNTMIHDFGTLSQNKKLVFKFQFSNVGKAELTLLNVETSSDNIVTDWSKEPILPGDANTINVLLDTEGILGEFEEKIIIKLNTISGIKELIVKGKVVSGE
ncbi:MAG: DUF1573 domain-containing protein [Saprospiraceae bacterium]|nr:DUF1573 domain-containing protein [Saprospiraceae bacterium]